MDFLIVDKSVDTAGQRLPVVPAPTRRGIVLFRTLIDDDKRIPLAVAFARARVEWQVLDDSVRADFAALAKVQPGDFSVSSKTADDTKWVVAYSVADGPAAWYLYDLTSAASLTGTVNAVNANVTNQVNQDVASLSYVATAVSGQIFELRAIRDNGASTCVVGARSRMTYFMLLSG